MIFVNHRTNLVQQNTIDYVQGMKRLKHGLVSAHIAIREIAQTWDKFRAGKYSIPMLDSH